MKVDISVLAPSSGTPPSGLTDPLDTLLGYLLRRASSMMMTDLGTSLTPIGLRPTEATILILIRANPGCTQSDIGRVLGIARANMVPLMAGLIKQGFIGKSPMDGRSQALDLTALGTTKVAEAQAIIDAHEERFQSQLDDKTRATLLAALRKLRAD